MFGYRTDGWKRTHQAWHICNVQPWLMFFALQYEHKGFILFDVCCWGFGCIDSFGIETSFEMCINFYQSIRIIISNILDRNILN